MPTDIIRMQVIVRVRYTAIRTRLAELREKRMPPQSTAKLISYFRPAVNGKPEEIQRAIRFLLEKGRTSTPHILDKICADPRAGEAVFPVLAHNMGDEGIGVLANMVAIDQIRNTSQARTTFANLLEKDPEVLHRVYERDRNLAFSLFLEITKDADLAEERKARIWNKLLQYCFLAPYAKQSLMQFTIGWPSTVSRTELELQRTRRLFGNCLLKDYCAKDKEILFERLCQHVKTSMLGHPPHLASCRIHEAIDVVLKALITLPEDLRARVVGELFSIPGYNLKYLFRWINDAQQDRRIHDGHYEHEVEFVSADFMQHLFTVNEDAAVAALRSMIYPVVGTKMPDGNETIGIAENIVWLADSPFDPSYEDPFLKQVRYIKKAACIRKKSDWEFLAGIATDGARILERHMGDNRRLLKAFFASYEPDDINAIVLLYGLFIWDAVDVVRELGWRIPNQPWKAFNVKRLLNQRAENFEKVIAKFVNSLHRTEEARELFIDILAIVAIIKGDEFIAESFDRVAERHPDKEMLIQELASSIDAKRFEYDILGAVPSRSSSTD